ncbi:MAG TPA: NAD-dependent deacylase [Thermoanaerobaculia bacterium]|nr:NAD-dependent deacylase [Thermoanaerobaculia bacterium]HQP86345.1 NAD-dependent deacylase [Thermoanaerobaculia bacterium]
MPNAAKAAAPDPTAVDAAARILRRARSVLFVTGAGISADSGLPTYRGVGGLYESDATEDGLPIEVLLSGETFRRSPATTWRYLGAIERACRGARPNRAHQAIAALENALPRVVVLTQNIDGLHRAAGSRDVIEIHGDVHRLACTRCTFRTRVPDYEGLEMPPRCPECAAPVRPEVVLFGEMLPTEAVSRLEEELRRGFDAVVSIGTTSVFPYVAAPVHMARAWGAGTVEVNPGETEVSGIVDVRLRCGAAAAMDALVSAANRSPVG